MAVTAAELLLLLQLNSDDDDGYYGDDGVFLDSGSTHGTEPRVLIPIVRILHHLNAELNKEEYHRHERFCGLDRSLRPRVKERDYYIIREVYMI